MSQEHSGEQLLLHQQHIQYEILAIIFSTCLYFRKYNSIELILLIFITLAIITIDYINKHAICYSNYALLLIM